ncbi:MAG: hypothetical protein K0V04_46240, partial [Deltaproteobacteria bacterium]|nr:hypothetical protein [Deltaproteobacteria bacterium]
MPSLPNTVSTDLRAQGVVMTSMRRRWTMVLALAAGCGGASTEVDIATHVGPRFTRHDAQQRRENALAVGRTLLSELMPQPRTGSPATTPHRDEPVHPPTDAEQLASLINAVRTAPLDELGGPARRLAAASATVWPQVREALLADRKAPKGDYRALLDAIGGDVPNRYGYFARAWKKAHGFSVKLSTDWFEDLLMLPPGRISGGLRAVYRDTVIQVAMARAASAIGRDDPA